MRLSTEEKQTLVSRYHTGESVAEICADTGIANGDFFSSEKKVPRKNKEPRKAHGCYTGHVAWQAPVIFPEAAQIQCNLLFAEFQFSVPAFESVASS